MKYKKAKELKKLIVYEPREDSYAWRYFKKKPEYVLISDLSLPPNKADIIIAMSNYRTPINQFQDLRDDAILNYVYNYNAICDKAQMFHTMQEFDRKGLFNYTSEEYLPETYQIDLDRSSISPEE